MGVDFLQTVGKRIKVARDKDLIGLAEGDLFTRRLEHHFHWHWRCGSAEAPS